MREALALTKELGWRINLELKRQPPPQDHYPIVETVCDLIKQSRLDGGQVVLSSFNHQWLHQAQETCAGIEVQALMGLSLTDPIIWGPLEFSTYTARSTLIEPSKIQELTSQGIHVNLFTVNDVADWQRFIPAGVSGFFTDVPQLLVAYLKGSTERPETQAA